MKQKDFSRWFALKPVLNNRPKPVLFQERDVWWCSIGYNVGDEEDGKNNLCNRPVLVVKKFNTNIFIGVPLTTRIKQNPYYVKINFKGRDQCTMISQIRLFDKKRISSRLGKVTTSDFEKVKKAVQALFD